MKFLFLLGIISTAVFALPTTSKRILPVTKEDEAVKRDRISQEKLKALGVKKEDCDEKAKKPIEIKPESISLGSGSAGCTLDQGH